MTSGTNTKIFGKFFLSYFCITGGVLQSNSLAGQQGSATSKHISLFKTLPSISLYYFRKGLHIFRTLFFVLFLFFNSDVVDEFKESAE